MSGDRKYERVELALAQAAGLPVGVVALNHYGLTPRQWQVVDLLLTGHTDKAMAARLEIDVHTVKNHLKAVYTKLGVRHRREALLKLWRFSSLGSPETRDSVRSGRGGLRINQSIDISRQIEAEDIQVREAERRAG